MISTRSKSASLAITTLLSAVCSTSPPFVFPSFTHSPVDWVVSGGWDNAVKVWDVNTEAENVPLHVYSLPGKVYAMDVTRDGCVRVLPLTYSNLLVALENRQIAVCNLHSLTTPPVLRESLLKFNLRCIRALLDGSGYVVGSIEGRAGVEFLAESAANKPFSFRCHRKPDAFGAEVIYPVNAIAVHPMWEKGGKLTSRYGSFATGGSDGSVSIWDAVAKKRLAYFTKWASCSRFTRSYTPGVVCLAFNRDGTKLAIASSYMFEQGPGSASVELPSSVAIRSIKEEDVVFKSVV